MSKMDMVQRIITLEQRNKGFYIITKEITSHLPEIKEFSVGLLNLFMQHTSAALTVNENWDPDTRTDLSDSMDRIVPESAPYRHTDEGSDDMPAHVKSSLLGPSLTIPIRNGSLLLGTWQDIELAEFRRAYHSRHIVCTIQGLRESK
ncbi:hypothetical protein SJAG_02434 [Schizosaccharomyces japonicus yFS275]|uniref:YjbQ family protein n=1 Tax=Schizosaccharomyces japonicus (strain yFS275 / FY16936) TaxID=402676 RepID=B6K2G5_SCHJY|nr:hypothetical protein SJAG_02434 [Schizosaccharomyces japonicus yFS275]EEB07346.2 hypothetical protein SJAG_02434 [Schizosaccharomyces japonicus yFS275]